MQSDSTILAKFTPAKSEAWRFSGLKELDLSSYVGKSSSPISNSQGIEVRGPMTDEGPAGDVAPIEMPESLKKPFADFGSGRLEQSTCQSKNGFWCVTVPAMTQGNLYLQHEGRKNKGWATNRLLLEVGQGAHLRCEERCLSLYSNSLHTIASRICVKKDAVLDYVLFNKLPFDATNFNFLEIQAEAGAQVNLTIINLGSAYTRQEVTAYLKGEGANVQLKSLTVVDGTREVDQRTLQIHQAPNAKSDLLFKNVLDDSARTVFSGLIRVAPGAQKTDAYQKNRNLLLSDDATANSLPGLEIEANDVRCTHGATCGRLDAEELFYLRSRGISQAEAKQILVGGYCQEILASLPENMAQEVGDRLSIT